MLSYDLSDEHRLFQGTVREFAEGAIGPVAEELDRTGRFPLELVAAAAELGLLGIPIPAEWGGAGADTVSYAIAIEELARVDQSFAITVAAHTSLGTTADPALRKRPAAAAMAAPAGLGRASRSIRSDRVRSGLRRRRHTHHRPAGGAASG